MDGPLKEVVFGVRWSKQPPSSGGVKNKGIDIDASCVLLDDQQHVIDVVDPTKLRSSDGSVLHTGDSKSGGGSWDDERIYVFLSALPARTASVLFQVTS